MTFGARMVELGRLPGITLCGTNAAGVPSAGEPAADEPAAGPEPDEQDADDDRDMVQVGAGSSIGMDPVLAIVALGHPDCFYRAGASGGRRDSNERGIGGLTLNEIAFCSVSRLEGFCDQRAADLPAFRGQSLAQIQRQCSYGGNVCTILTIHSFSDLLCPPFPLSLVG